MNRQVEESKLRTFVILASVTFLPCLVLSQQVDTAWVRTYNGSANGDDRATGIAVDDIGNVYVTGSSFDSATGYSYATVKYRPNGDTAWVRHYHGPRTGDDLAFAIGLGPKGSVYVTGSDNGDYLTLKYDSTGNLKWFANYQGPIPLTEAGAFALATDSSENVYVTGKMKDQYNEVIWLTIKYDSAGNQIWTNGFYGGTVGLAIAVAANENVYVVGFRLYDYQEFAVTRYLANGNQLWARIINGVGGRAKALALDSSGDVYATGYVFNNGSSYDYTTVKYYPNGDTAWVRYYNGPANHQDMASAIQLDDSGNVYVTGTSNNGGPQYGQDYSSDYATIKYTPNGDVLWVRRFNRFIPADCDTAVAMAIDDVGNIYVTGLANECWNNVPAVHYQTIKYAPNGDTLWVRYFGDLSYGRALTLDKKGNMYVTGYSKDPYSATNYDYTTIKYSPLSQLKGDLNLDGVLSTADVVLMLNCAFTGEAIPAAPAACDLNCDGKVTPADVVVLLNMVFASAPAPC